MLTDNNSNKPNVDQHYPKSKKKVVVILSREREKKRKIKEEKDTL